MAGSGLPVTNVQVMAYVAEIIPGTTPSTNLKNFRANNQSLNPNEKFDSSKEYRADRMIPDNVLLDLDPGGDVGGELSYGSDDDLLAAMLESPGWYATPTQTNVAFTASSSITVTTTSGMVANMLLYSSGATTAANNGVFNISSVTSNTIITTQTTLATEGAGTSKTVKIIGVEGATSDFYATFGTPASLPSFTAFLGGSLATAVSVGTGYTAGDTVTISGGTSTAPLILQVLSATNSGTVDSLVIGQPGIYSAIPTNPVSQLATSGNGSGLSANISWGVATITGSAGTNVTQQPTLTIAAPTGQNAVQAVANVVIDEGAATIVGAAVQVPGQGYLTVPSVTAAGGGGIGAAIGSTTQPFTTLGLTAGQWLNIGGAATINQFATTTDNGLARITDITRNLITLDSAPLGFTNDTGAGKKIRMLWGDYVRNGTFMQSFTWQRAQTDIGMYFINRGEYISTGTLNLTSAQFIECNFTFMGLTSTTSLAPVGSGAPTLVNNNPIFSTSNNVVRVNIGGQTGIAYAKDLRFTANNNLRAQKAVGTLGNVGIGNGQFMSMMEGTFYLSQSLYQTFKNNRVTSISVPLQDGNGNILIFEVTSARITTANTSAAQINNDVTVAMTFNGQLDTLTNSQAQITRIANYGA